MSKMACWKKVQEFHILACVLATAILYMTGTAHAKEDQGPKESARHGGRVLILTDVHAEFVLGKTGDVTIYLMDAGGRPLSSKAATGTLHVQFPDGDKEAVALSPSADGAFLTGKIQDADHPTFNAVLSLTRNGKTENLRFSWGAR